MCFLKGEKNILGTELISCSSSPMTGFHRDGFCNSLANDPGEHTVCAKLTNKFLMFSKELGNDLITPRPEYEFPGLKDGDRWCLCADRWLQAYNFNVAPYIILEATHNSLLKKITFNELKKYSTEYKNIN